MRIVFLDSSTLTKGDMDFSSLEDLGELTLHDTTDPNQVIDRCRDHEVIITNKVVLDAKTISALPSLKLILLSSTGTNVIDLSSASSAGISVCNVAGYSTMSVAQHAAALLLSLATQVHSYGAQADQWPFLPIFTRLDFPVIELAGKTCGIVGMGAIGSAFCKIARSLGMKVQALKRDSSTVIQDSDLPRLKAPDFFTSSDVISLHSPLTAKTENIINAKTLELMKPSAFLINTSRGGLIDEKALANSLLKNQIAGAGLDVLCQEPPDPSNPLLSKDLLEKNLIITPHTAWTSRQARERLLKGLEENLKAFLRGKPINLVQPHEV